MELSSAALLIYCMAVVPLQLSFWNYIGPCDRNPTANFDMFVDFFFMVSG